MNQYAFVLGRVYTLSLAELLQVLNKYDPEAVLVDASFEVAVIETALSLDIQKLQGELGGIIKILKVVDKLAKREQDSVNFALKNYFKPSKLKNDILKNTKGKITFGVSIYLLDEQTQAFGEPKRLGMFIKRGMQDTGSSVRLVIPEFNSLALASVVVTHNLLLEKGAEICILAGVDRIYVCKTLSVQDFEDYGRRDYQRPARDDGNGMIPPKVAQSMINLSGLRANEVGLDPFCGVGTILQESMLMGYRMIGSDLSKFAINNSDKNLEWFRNRYKLPKGRSHLEVSDAKEVSKMVERVVSLGVFKTISAVITEGYLGPLFTKFPDEFEIKKSFEELKELWTGSLKDWVKFLPKGAKVVFCLPAYKRDRNTYILFPPLDDFLKLGYSQSELISQKVKEKYQFLRFTNRSTIIYDRKDQIVAREIVVLTKN